ncbi:MAG: amino acid permease [Methanomassiliicoccales archaeon]
MTSREEGPSEGQEGGSGGVEVSLRRNLGLLEVLMIGVGPNIGSTIFVLVGFGVSIAGPALLLALMLNFVVTLFTAFSYAELSSAFPETGGGYRWVKEGMFPPFGFLGGWMSWVGHCIACGVYVLGFGAGMIWLFEKYNLDFFGVPNEIMIKIFAVIIAVAFSYLNYRGVKGTGRSGVYVSIVLVGIVVTYIFFAVAALFSTPDPSSSYEPFLPYGLVSIASSMGFTFMIFEGYEIVAQTGEEARDPERTVPRAMFLCLIISTILFVVITAVTIGASGWGNVANWGEAALANTSENIVPVLGSSLIAIGTVIGSIAAVNSVIFSSSRVSFAMGRDGNLPTIFGKLHKKNQTPSTSIILSGAIIVGISIFLPIDKVASAADVLILLLFILVNISALSLRKKMPDANRSFHIPFFPYIPLIAIGAKIVISITLFEVEPISWYVALAVIYVGLLIHYFTKGKKEIERVEAPTREPMSAERRKRFRVLLPVDDPKNTALLDLGAILAKEKDGELLLTTVLEVPSNLPLKAVDTKLVDDKKEMLEKLQVQAELKGIATRALVSVSHDVVTAITDTAKEESANIVVMGWKGYTRTQKRILGRKMDAILHETPCDVLVLRAEDKLSPDNILVLSGGTWHVSKATETASQIAKDEGSRITILNVILNEKYMDRARSYSKRLREIVESHGVPVISKEVRPETIVGGVVAESMDYDLLVIGASAARRWEKFDFGPIQDRIAKEAKCPVLVYKRVAGTELEKK